MALTKVQAEGINLADTFAFSGTVSGAGLTSPFPTNTTSTSEGGANTTNICQGLAKGWCHLTGTGTPAAADSLNVGSITDTASGRYTFNFSTNFGNANYVCVSGMCGNDGATTEGRIQSVDATPATNAFGIRNILASNNATRDDPNIFVTFHGDLA